MSTTTHVRVLAVAALCATLTGCGSITGLDGTSSYGCKAPEGVKCDSVSGTYYNALQNNLPSQRKSSMPVPGGSAAPPLPARRDALLLTSASGTSPSRVGTTFQPTPLRAAPRVMRLWIKPWEDADRDLNRGGSRAEWDHAAGERFNRLDTDHSGRITLAQLQHMRAERMEQFMQGRGRGRHGPAQGGEASRRSLPPDDPDGGANPPG